jgi:hypothetical protein
MELARSSILITIMFLLAGALSGCAMGTQLQTATADPKGIQGTFDLMTYGCRYPNDIEHAAFLIAPEKASVVDLFVPATSYKTKRGLPADQALAEADAHVRCGVRTVETIRVHRIPDGAGGTLGYEVLPRYPATDETGMDPLDVSYSLKDGKVIVYIRLFPDVERKLYLTSPSSGGQ